MKRFLTWRYGVAVGVIFGCMISSGAAIISQEAALEQARSWMAGNPVMAPAAGRTVASMDAFPDSGGYSVYVVRFVPAGYLVLNSDDRFPPVVAFSVDSGVDLSDDPQNAFRAMLLQHVEKMEGLLARPELIPARATTVKEVQAVTELYGPFLETTWNQCNPYNLYCPDDPDGSEYYGYRAAVGCVPTAYAQVLNFHRWPLFGEGSRSYTDSSGSLTGSYSAVFSDRYNWGSMEATYDAWSTNYEEPEEAVAELMSELGVAAGADYESDGTSASTSTLGERLEDYFYFEPIAYHSDSSSLIEPMEADLRAGFPCVVAIPGHAVVADGLMVDGGVTTYHINYGWGGSNNGWYTADNVAGAALQYGVTSLRPQLLAFPATNSLVVSEGEPVEVQWMLPKRRESEVSTLEVYQYAGGSWQPFWTDTAMNSRRFSDTTVLWDDCADFSGFEVTTMSPIYTADWAVCTTGEVENCFYKAVPEYTDWDYHLTSVSTITPTAATRLLLHTKYTLATDRFSVLVSSDRSTFTEVWSSAGSAGWSDVAIDLAAYAGQAIYVRLQYTGGSYYADGGVWIDSISTQETTYPELEGQPVYYTSLTNLAAGSYTLAARLTDIHSVEAAALALLYPDGR